MAKIITFSNQKGGVAKTTSTVMTAGYLTSKEFKVLMVDADAQCNTSSFAIENFTDISETHPTLFDLIFDANIKVEDAIVSTEFGDVLLGHRNMWDMDRSDTDHGVLKEIIEDVADGYDYVLIDTPPNLGWSQIASLYAAQYVVIPTDADNLAVQNIPFLINTISNVAVNNRLKVAGILFTKVDSRLGGLLVERKMMDDVKEYAASVDIPVFAGYIRQAKSPLGKSSLTHTNPFGNNTTHKVKTDYSNFVEQLLKAVN